MNISDLINLYLSEKKSILNNYPVKDVVTATEMIFETYSNGGTIFSMGNGGNSGTVDHLYCDFKHHPFVSEDKSKPLNSSVKRLSFKSLCSSPSEITGLVNDLGQDMMFADNFPGIYQFNSLPSKDGKALMGDVSFWMQRTFEHLYNKK